MAKELPELSIREWYAAMEQVLTDQVSIDPTEKWGSVEAPGNKGNDAGGAKTSTEIPDAHPEDGGPVLPTEPQKHDTDDVAAIQDEIPADGGFTTKPAKTPEAGPVSKEIPADGPASSDSPADKPDKAPKDTWSTRVGKPEPTGTPSGSFAQLQDVKYDGEGWATRGAPGLAPSKTVEQWSDLPAGTADGSGPDGSPSKSDSLDRAPKTSFKSDPKPGTSNADEDLDNDRPDNLSLPDGTFFVQNVGDLKAKIDAVKTADQTNPRATTHPWYAEVKRHLMNRAADLGATHLIPSDWNLSMGMRADAELARDYSTEERKQLAKEGKALPDLSYPIETAEDLRNAIDLARSGHGNVAAAKALIRRRAKALGVELPADFK